MSAWQSQSERPQYVGLHRDPIPAPRWHESRSETLHRCLTNYFVGVPERAIVDTWASHGTPSVVVLAFLMCPHDGAAGFFERDVMPIADFADESHPRTRAFIAECRSREIEAMVADALEDTDPGVVVARVLAGFHGHEAGRTALMDALRVRG